MILIFIIVICMDQIIRNILPFGVGDAYNVDSACLWLSFEYKREWLFSSATQISQW